MTAAAYTKFFDAGTPEHRVATIVINRPDAANAFNEEIMEAVTAEAENLKNDASCRLVLIQGAGKHFSAGADLGWMKKTATLAVKENLKEAHRLINMFEAIRTIPVPTIAVVKGAAFGGGVGIIAACDYAVATETAKFALSEVRLGLVPAVILPYLNAKMATGDLNRFALSGRVFLAEDARAAGLVQVVTSNAKLPTVLLEEVNQLLQCSPQAHAEFKKLLYQVEARSNTQGQYTAEVIARVRASAAGKDGLGAFFANKNAAWVATLPGGTNLLI